MNILISLTTLSIILISPMSIACPQLDNLKGKWIVDSATAIVYNKSGTHTEPINNFTFEITQADEVYKISTCQGTDSSKGIWWCRTGKIIERQNELYAINDKSDVGRKIGSCSVSSILDIAFDNRKLQWRDAPAYLILHWQIKLDQNILTLDFNTEMNNGPFVGILATMHRE